MAVLSSTTERVAVTSPTAPALLARFNNRCDAMLLAAFHALMGWLCRASRGYLCPPDMPSIMYPEEGPASALADLSVRGCCDEKLSGK